jgi:hypothetical protein
MNQTCQRPKCLGPQRQPHDREALRTDQDRSRICPVLLKNDGRIEALFTLNFLAILARPSSSAICALPMKRENSPSCHSIGAAQLRTPDHGTDPAPVQPRRAAPTPAGRPKQCRSQFTDLQRHVLELLAQRMPFGFRDSQKFTSSGARPITKDRRSCCQQETHRPLACLRLPNSIGAEEWLLNRPIGVRAAATKLGKRNGHLAMGSFRRKYIVDSPAELIGDKFANDMHAIAGFSRRYDQRSAGLPPFEDQPITRTAIAGQTPTNRHLP